MRLSFVFHVALAHNFLLGVYSKKEREREKVGVGGEREVAGRSGDGVSHLVSIMLLHCDWLRQLLTSHC